MIYARSEYEDKERSLEHVQPGIDKSHNILANFRVPNETSIHTMHTRIQKWH